MRKGVSPVVAIVLLIAIAVISAVAVWTWVGPLTSKPPMGSTTQYSLTVIKCYPGATGTLDIKNTGGVKINGQSFSLIDKTTGGTLSTSAFTTTLAPGEVNSTLSVGTTLLSGVAYALRAQNFPDIEFTC